MEGTLKVTPEKLQSTATEFQSLGDSINTYTNEMVTKINALTSSIWQGEAAEQYNMKFNSLQEDMSQIYSMITEHVNDLNEMAQVYLQAEAANTAAAEALATDIIS